MSSCPALTFGTFPRIAIHGDGLLEVLLGLEVGEYLAADVLVLGQAAPVHAYVVHGRRGAHGRQRGHAEALAPGLLGALFMPAHLPLPLPNACGDVGKSALASVEERERLVASAPLGLGVESPRDLAPNLESLALGRVHKNVEGLAVQE